MLITRNPECGCKEIHAEIGMATVILHMEKGFGEAFIFFGDWEEEQRFECENLTQLYRKAKEYITSMPTEDEVAAA